MEFRFLTHLFADTCLAKIKLECLNRLALRLLRVSWGLDLKTLVGLVGLLLTPALNSRGISRFLSIFHNLRYRPSSPVSATSYLREFELVSCYSYPKGRVKIFSLLFHPYPASQPWDVWNIHTGRGGGLPPLHYCYTQDVVLSSGSGCWWQVVVV